MCNKQATSKLLPARRRRLLPSWILRSLLLSLRARALAKFGEVDTVPVSENSFNIAKQY